MADTFTPRDRVPAARRWAAGVYIAAALALGWLAPVHGQQLLDRVVARVASIPITQTDVDAALALGIVEPAPGEDRLTSATQQLIDRRLLLTEVTRFPPPAPPDAAVDALVARMKGRAGADFDAVMRRTGLDEPRLRELARDSLRIEAYLNQRFGTAAQVTLQEAQTYYETHRERFARDGVVPPFDDVEAAVREAAGVERRRANVAAWLADLRVGGDVVEVTPQPEPRAAPRAN